MTAVLKTPLTDAELKQKAALASIFASAVLTLGKLVLTDVCDLELSFFHHPSTPPQPQLSATLPSR